MTKKVSRRIERGRDEMRKDNIHTVSTYKKK